MNPIPLILIALCLCSVAFVRSPKGRETFPDRRREAINPAGLYAQDFARSYILRTNYPAPSPAAGPQEAPQVKAVPISRAAVVPQSGPIVLPQFVYTNIPPNYWWHRLEADTPNGPWRTNEKNMTMPPSGTVRLVRTNKVGYFQMFATPNQLP